MKARSILFALGALLAGNAFAANPFSIYFNAEGTSSCYVDNVTNINVQPDGNIVATTSGTPHVNNSGACGVSTSFTIGGSVSGQTGAFTLAVTAGNQTVNVGSSATSYVFPTGVATGTNYSVSVQTPPTGQTCTVANGTGIIGTVNVTNVNVTCATGAAYTIGGSVSGLTATGLVMAVTAGSQTKSVASGATSYVFPNPVATGTNYTVSVQTSPAGLSCTVANPTGTIGSANVINANVTCQASSIVTNCTAGTASDAAGYTAICSGSYLFHSGGLDTTKGPNQYTFDFVFGGPWPGARFGTSDIFTVGTKQYISIPFKPSPGHTISLNENQTYTSDAITFSVSTSPGLFNNSQANAADNAVSGAQGVVCVATNNPALKLSSNGNTSAQCKLNPNTLYWFNVIPAKYSANQGQWVSGFTGASARFAVTIYSVN